MAENGPFPCPSFPWFFWLTKDNPQINQGFCPLPKPLEPWKKLRESTNTFGTKIIADPENCFQELISEKLQIFLRDGPCLELIIVSSNFQALLLLQDKLLESVWKRLIPVKRSWKLLDPPLFRINSVIISARTVFQGNSLLKINQGILKNQGTEGQGWGPFWPPKCPRESLCGPPFARSLPGNASPKIEDSDPCMGSVQCLTTGEKLGPLQNRKMPSQAKQGKNTPKIQKIAFSSIFDVFLSYFACGGIFLFCRGSVQRLTTHNSWGDYQFVNERFPGVISEAEGVENPHYIVWIRLASLDYVYKRYGTLDMDINKGEPFKIHSPCPTTTMCWGQKKNLVSQCSVTRDTVAATPLPRKHKAKNATRV